MHHFNLGFQLNQQQQKVTAQNFKLMLPGLGFCQHKAVSATREV